MPEIGQTNNSEPVYESNPLTSPPTRLRLCKWLAGFYLFALLVPVLIYTILAIWNGIFHVDLLFMMIVGFPAAFFAYFRPSFSMGRDASIFAGYAVLLLTGTACVFFRNIANLWKIFLSIFLILLLLNLAYCVPNAVRFGIEEIH